MIYVSSVYDTIQTLIRKDQKGNSFNIKEFNRLANVVNLELYNFFVSKLEVGQDITENLKPFVVPNASISLTAGVGALPAAYSRMLGKPRTGSTTEIDLITRLELTPRLADELTKPTTEDPVAILGGLTGSDRNITVYPTSISSVVIDYLSTPATPILDYYIASSGLYVYLDEGATGVSVPTGAVYSDGTPGPTSVNSLTVNFKWDDELITVIVNMLLQKAGIVLGEQPAIEYGIAKETKETQE